MKILIIGYGSIGKRHHEVLLSLEDITSIDIVTKQTLKEQTCFASLDAIKNLNIYDYFIVASETVKHYEQLHYICSKVDNKKILVEKPLFDKNYASFECNNQIFTAYNLRFHPIVKELKILLQNEKIYYANIMAGQYLPTWRPEQDYTKSYSADLAQGGGVLRDLSHELDYMHWLFGDISIIKAISTKISDLEINSDDIFTALCKSKTGAIINVTMDYISKAPLRRILIHTQEKTITADFVLNTIEVYNKQGTKSSIELPDIDRNHTYTNMHHAIINDELSSLTTFSEGKRIVDIIDHITLEDLQDETI